ncbi:DUF2807 domain-containing protein [Flagellimonas hymeniacidonis]|uniref:DUF2807 domain-containing protein n=1 Tax=Flagellimonas hymeniacidonis TaxID=2603628 RepID=A0A5C8V6E4_9FLAO|nr:DUF2807 domain-containing protein [Flagellimonas hymeniacidonis]TXN37287.1 DUF2807 domain-containing protein [Flagellimonas hymeniacidonis]
MKKIKKTCIIAAFGLAMASCSYETIRVSEEIVTLEYDFDDITALEVATDFRAYVTFSETEERVRIEANDNLIEKINVYKDRGRLVVKLDNNLRIKGRETLNLFVTTRNISDFKASSDASIFLDSPLATTTVAIELSSDAYFEGDITANNFELRASSDSKAKLYLKANDAYMNLSSGADLDGESDVEKGVVKLSSDAVFDMIGNINDLEATLSSDSELKDYGLQVSNLEIFLSSDSDAYLTVSETIDVTANSDSRLFYKGDAEIIRQVLSSDGKVIKK